MNYKLLGQFIVLFLITQAIGLYVASVFIEHNIATTIVSEDPEDVSNALALIVYILAFTAGILIGIKLFKGKHLYFLLKAVETLAILGSSWIVFAVFVNSLIAALLSIILVGLRNIFSKNIMLRNISTILATAGAGALLGVSLGILPVLVFVIALAVYDLIAVFKTKHMVVMAKAISSRNLAFTFAMPTQNHTFELGAGDLVIPLLFASAALKTSSMTGLAAMIPSLVVLIGSILGLVVTINYTSKNIGKAIPALPLQVLLMVLLFGAAKLLGF